MELKIRLLFFAAAREITGHSETTMSFPQPLQLSLFLERLYTMYPVLLPYASSLRIAINGTYATDADLISPGDEVAIIPPVAGG